MISIYSNDHQSALKYLKDTEVNLYNVLIMAGDFNIRNSNWDLSYPFYSIHSDSLLKVANSLNLKLSSLIQQVPTYYSNNRNNVNLVINLFFLQLNFIEIDNHIIFPKLWYSSSYTLLTVDIFISKEFI